MRCATRSTCPSSASIATPKRSSSWPKTQRQRVGRSLCLGLHGLRPSPQAAGDRPVDRAGGDCITHRAKSTLGALLVPLFGQFLHVLGGTNTKNVPFNRCAGYPTEASWKVEKWQRSGRMRRSSWSVLVTSTVSIGRGCHIEARRVSKGV
jgi:hypothetical protein